MRFPRQMVIAHRGASGLVEFENTIESFQKAIDVKSDAIEIDIRRTKDKVIVVFHDATIEGKPINSITYKELLEITVKIGYRVPTLQETLAFIKGKILLDIEFKEAGYENEAVRLIHRYLNNNEFFIRSFEDIVLVRVHKIDPKIITGLLLGKDKPKNVLFTRFSELFPIFRIMRTKCNFVAPNHLLLILGYVTRMHLIGQSVSVWTVNDEKLMRKLFLKKKVDSIVTNYPDIAVSVLKSK